MVKNLKDSASVDAPLFDSLKAMGYAQAKTSDSLTVQAKYAIDNIDKFPKAIPEESKTELYFGYHQRYAETHPIVMHAVINGHYVLATEEHIKNKAIEKIEVGLVYAFSISSQEFGKLKNTEPEKHAMIKKVRDEVTVYCSNRLGDLKRAANKILSSGVTGTRATLDFKVSVKKYFDDAEKSVKIKQGKGDTTANPVKFKMAVEAFWKAYNAE
jgi:hypothetical protein